MYLNVSVEELNKRQDQAKGLDLAEKGQTLSIEVRKKMATSDAPKGDKKKRKTNPPAQGLVKGMLGKIMEDETGVYVVTPVATEVSVSATCIKLTPEFHTPDCVKDARITVDLSEFTQYEPSRLLNPGPTKVHVATNPGQSNVYFVPWANATRRQSNSYNVCLL